MKKIILTFAAVILSSTLAQAEFKLAYIDIQKAIQSSNAGKKAKEDLQKEADKKIKI